MSSRKPTVDGLDDIGDEDGVVEEEMSELDEAEIVEEEEEV